MVTYLARSAWTSTAASGDTLSGTKLRGVALHWPGTTQATIGEATQEGIAARLRSYRDYHVNTRGWRDIGYNIAIDQAGRVWMLRSTAWKGNMVGAHCASASNPDANHEYVGVLLLLGASETPSVKMIAAFRDWYHNRFLPGWPGRTDVRGHRQVEGAETNCPGNRAIALIDSGTFEQKPATVEDDMPLSDTDLAKVYAQVRKALDTPFVRTWSNYETKVDPADGGRYAWMASSTGNKILARVAALEALVAKVVAAQADDLTEEKVRQLLAEAVIDVNVTVDTGSEPTP